MKLKKYILTIIPLLFIFISCSNDKAEIEKVYQVYQQALLLKGNGGEIIDLLDDNSHQYLKNLHNKIKVSDSFNISQMKYIDRFNILSVRSLISNDSLLQLKTIDLFKTLFSSKKYNYQLKLSGNYPILETTFKGNKGNINLSNGFKIELNKENNIWKINLKSIYESKNEILKKVVHFTKINKFQYHNSNSINSVLLKNISNNTTKPFDLLFWPIEIDTDDLYINYHFSENLKCQKDQTWALVKRPKILFFLEEDELNKQFYSKFKEDIKFREFCKNRYNVTVITASCFIGKRFFKAFNVKNYPRIIVLDENNNIIQESVGYFITPEMFIKNSNKTGVIKYDLTKI